ncbi:hypothetical protein ACXR0O_16290 [Verrucomicrobiota bacterium sgz303538]
MHTKPFAILCAILAVTSMMLAGCGATKGKASAEKTVAKFHEQLNKGDFKGIYSAAHADFKSASTEKDFVALLNAVHRKLGAIKSSKQIGWRVNSFNFQTNVLLNYKTTFAGGDAVESFNCRIDGDKAVLLGYNINSNALITK